MFRLFAGAIKILLLGFLVFVFVAMCLVFGGCSGDATPQDTSMGKYRQLQSVRYVMEPYTWDGEYRDGLMNIRIVWYTEMHDNIKGYYYNALVDKY